MPKYKVTTTFTVTGTFEVKASSREEAEKMIAEDCGLVMGGSIHSNLNDEDIYWNFPTHFDKEITDVRKITRYVE